MFYDGDSIITWAEISSRDMPGTNEGFYCSVEFNGNNGGSYVDVTTLVGTSASPIIDMHRLPSNRDPKYWCTEREDPCRRVNFIWSEMPSTGGVQYAGTFDREEDTPMYS